MQGQQGRHRDGTALGGARTTTGPDLATARTEAGHRTAATHGRGREGDVLESSREGGPATAGLDGPAMDDNRVARGASATPTARVGNNGSAGAWGIGGAATT